MSDSPHRQREGSACHLAANDGGDSMSEIRARLVTRYYAVIEKASVPSSGRAYRRTPSPSRARRLLCRRSLFRHGLVLHGGLALLFSGFLDTLDGSVARLTADPTPQGRCSILRWTDMPNSLSSRGWLFTTDTGGCSSSSSSRS